MMMNLIISVFIRIPCFLNVLNVLLHRPMLLRGGVYACTLIHEEGENCNISIYVTNIIQL
jgi:hypothetical protein